MLAGLTGHLLRSPGKFIGSFEKDTHIGPLIAVSERAATGPSPLRALSGAPGAASFDKVTATGAGGPDVTRKADGTARGQRDTDQGPFGMPAGDKPPRQNRRSFATRILGSIK